MQNTETIIKNTVIDYYEQGKMDTDSEKFAMNQLLQYYGTDVDTVIEEFKRQGDNYPNKGDQNEI